MRRQALVPTAEREGGGTPPGRVINRGRDGAAHEVGVDLNPIHQEGREVAPQDVGVDVDIVVPTRE